MITRIKVSFRFSPTETIPVGEMLRSTNGQIFFQFDGNYLKNFGSPSPFKLKQLPDPQVPSSTESPIFDGLFGVFADSLPDGWGLLMMSRAMKRTGVDFKKTSAIDRLAFIGSQAMGALVYEPETNSHFKNANNWDLSVLANHVNQIIEGYADEILPALLELGGSPGGARPKILVGINPASKSSRTSILSGAGDLTDGFEHWLLKFRGKDEGSDASVLEYIYALTARTVGIEMADCKLIEDKEGGLWFATKRFDRGPSNQRIHVHSAAGLLHANFRLPSLDYEELLKLTRILTKNETDVLSMFRLACFNVIFHNRDDHAKNFSFIMSSTSEWRLAPAYDLTLTPGPGGEHTTAILGEGRNPSKQHCLKLAEKVGIKGKVAKRIWEEVESGKDYMKGQLKKFKLKNSLI